MKNYLETHIRVALTLLLLAAAAVIGAFVAHVRGEAAAALVRERLEEKELLMYDLAEMTDRNAADAAIAAIIPECDRRAEYESLLVKLGDLSKKDLISLQSLFEACGAFDAQRKALMVAKLEREFESYLDFHALLNEFEGTETAPDKTKAWESIVTNEKLRSSLLTDLYNIQKEIISVLILGAGGNGTVNDLVSNARDIGELLSVYDHNIDGARELVKH